MLYNFNGTGRAAASVASRLMWVGGFAVSGFSWRSESPVKSLMVLTQASAQRLCWSPFELTGFSTSALRAGESVRSSQNFQRSSLPFLGTGFWSSRIGDALLKLNHVPGLLRILSHRRGFLCSNTAGSVPEKYTQSG